FLGLVAQLDEEVHLLLVDLPVGPQLLAQNLHLGVVNDAVGQQHLHGQFAPICHGFYLLNPQRSLGPAPTTGTRHNSKPPCVSAAYQRPRPMLTKNVAKLQGPEVARRAPMTLPDARNDKSERLSDLSLRAPFPRHPPIVFLQEAPFLRRASDFHR